jgi:hypothetical protein
LLTRTNVFKIVPILGDFAAVISVGATDKNDMLAKFSSRGPGPFSRGPLFASQKPDLVAPGVSIQSAFNKDDNSMAVMSGTSMASKYL